MNMFRIFKAMVLATFVLNVAFNAATATEKSREKVIENKKENAMQEVIKKGSLGGFKGDSKIFSGDVSVEMAFGSNAWRDFSGGVVRFERAARSAWHTHPKGQTLLVLEGAIITGSKVGEKMVVHVARKGDVISCPPGIEHWHGALDNESGTHLALTGEINGKNVEWHDKVSNEEYQKAIKSLKNN